MCDPVMNKFFKQLWCALRGHKILITTLHPHGELWECQECEKSWEEWT